MKIWKAAQVERAGINLKPSGRMSERSALPGAPIEAGKTVGIIEVDDPIFSCRDVDVYYGEKHAIKKVGIDIAQEPGAGHDRPVGMRQVHVPALPQPHERHHPGRTRRRFDPARWQGHPRQEAGRGAAARARRHGVQKPNPFPKSIYENVAYGPRIHGLAGDRVELDEIVHSSLQRAGLWEEVKDRLAHPGTSLSGGQQQRLCIARTIAVNPEVILMDEPCSALDPIATARIEDLMEELRQSYAIVIVTHSMQQAARVSQRTAYFHLGDLIEVGETDRIFTNPRHKLTEDYITGRFG